MYSFDFQLMNIRFHLESPFEFIINDPIRPFIKNKLTDWDVAVRYNPVDFLPEPSDGCWIDDICYSSKGKFFRANSSSLPYACLLGDDGNYQMNYVAAFERYVVHASSMLNMLGMEKHMLDYDGMMLHSSVVRYRNKAILFTAPCGTGKSTQAGLWEESMDAEILNGDRAGIRRIEGNWFAHGLPFAGTSGIFRDESAPICAIVVLGQAKENSISRLRASAAISRLLPEISCRRWDSEFMTKVFDLSIAFVQTVPVFYLDCTPDSRAVMLLSDTLEKEGIL